MNEENIKMLMKAKYTSSPDERYYIEIGELERKEEPNVLICQNVDDYENIYRTVFQNCYNLL